MPIRSLSPRETSILGLSLKRWAGTQDHYYTKHHTTINLCKYSPGPKYGATSSLGEWSLRCTEGCGRCVSEELMGAGSCTQANKH